MGLILTVVPYNFKIVIDPVLHNNR